MNPPENAVCPVCGAALQENARFCLHCMTSFDEKTEIPATGLPKRAARKRAVLLACALLLLAALGAGVFFLLSGKNAPSVPDGETAAGDESAPSTESGPSAEKTDPGRAPLIDYETFLLAIPKTAERLGCADCFDPAGFFDATFNQKTNTVKYTTSVSLDGGRLDLFFRNGGDVITLILSDIPETRLPDARRIAAAVHAAVTNYYSEILNVLSDPDTYPRGNYREPFIEFFTDMTGRTARYQAALEAGEAISTETVLIRDKEEDGFVAWFVTRRETADGTLYDLILRFDYDENPEVEHIRAES
ncbi:MAG: zinc ribbon domain-containing protein [Oscillospiraceae bacterium]|nr:zinc ribbon domain-containing protein [Oscillospiraceae bacterium]